MNVFWSEIRREVSVGWDPAGVKNIAVADAGYYNMLQEAV